MLVIRKGSRSGVGTGPTICSGPTYDYSETLDTHFGRIFRGSGPFLGGYESSPNGPFTLGTNFSRYSGRGIWSDHLRNRDPRGGLSSRGILGPASCTCGSGFGAFRGPYGRILIRFFGDYGGFGPLMIFCCALIAISEIVGPINCAIQFAIPPIGPISFWIGQGRPTLGTRFAN